MPVEGLQVGDTPFSVIGIFYTSFRTSVASLCGLLKSNAMDINESMSCANTHTLWHHARKTDLQGNTLRCLVKCLCFHAGLFSLLNRPSSLYFPNSGNPFLMGPHQLFFTDSPLTESHGSSRYCACQVSFDCFLQERYLRKRKIFSVTF